MIDEIEIDEKPSRDSDASGREDGQILAKNQSQTRWVILFLACVMLFGYYYSLDNPAALKTQLHEYMSSSSVNHEMNFSLMYTFYATPNIILPFFGGYIVDKFGVRSGLLLFSSLVTIGQIIVAIGLSLKSWPIIYLGRLIFGCGGESFQLANSALWADWFKGREMAFAFGAVMSTAKLGSVLNFIFSPMIASKTNTVVAFWFGAILCSTGLISVLITMPIDKAMDERIQIQSNYEVVSMSNPIIGTGDDVDVERDKSIGSDGIVMSIMKSSLQYQPIVSDTDNQLNNPPNDEENDDSVSFKHVLSFPLVFWVLMISCITMYGIVFPFNNISSSLLLERNYFQIPASSCHLLDRYQCQSSDNPPIHCSSSQWYQPPIPYNCSINGRNYNPLSRNDIDCTDHTWSEGCLQEYCSRLHHAETTVSFIMSIPYSISILCCMPIGFFIDRFGYRAIICTLAPLLMIIVHSCLGYNTSLSPEVLLVGQGFAYTGFLVVFWPLIPIVIEKKVVGLGFGISKCVQNSTMAIMSVVVAIVFTASGDRYIPNVELVFVILAIAGFCGGLYMNYYDIYHGNILNTASPKS